MADLADTAQAYDAMGTALPSDATAPSWMYGSQPATVKGQLDAVGIPSTPSQPQQPDPAAPLPAPPGDTASVPGEASPVGNLGLMTKPGGGIASPNAGGLGNQPAPPPAQAPVDNPQGIYGAGAPPGPQPDLYSNAPSPSSQPLPFGQGTLNSPTTPANAPAPPGPGQVPGSDDTQGAAPAGSYNAPGSPPAAPPASSGKPVDGNNFGNIRPTSGGGFNTYATPQDGVAAMSQNLTAYKTQHGINTLLGLTSRWAPKGDGANDPVAYANTIGKATGIDPNAPIDLADPAIQAKIIPAMASVEHGAGTKIDPPVLMAGIQAGLSGKGGVAVGRTDGTQFAGPGAPPDNTPPRASVPLAPTPSQQHELSSVGLPAQAYQGNPWFALASGLMGKRSLGEGMSAGFGNLNQMGQQNFENQLKLGQMNVENKRMDNQMAYQNSMLGIQAGRLGMEGNTATGQPFVGKDAQGNDTAMVRLKNGQTIALPGLPASVVNNLNNNAPGTVATKEGAKEGAKDASESINSMYNSAAEASIQNEQLTPLIAGLKSGQVATGPGLAAVKRTVSNMFGVDLGSDPTQTQLTAAQAAQLRGTSAFPKNMRNVREFGSVMDGLVNVDLQNPAAMTKVATGLQNLNDLRTGMRDDFVNAIQQDPTLRTNPDKYEAWEAQEIAKWRNGLQQKGGLYGDQPVSNSAKGATEVGQAAQPQQQASNKPPIGSFWSQK